MPIKFSKLCCSARTQPRGTNNESNIVYKNQIIGGCACALIHMTIGVLYGFTATTLPEMMDSRHNDSLVLTEEEATLVVSGLSIGALAGSFVSALLLFHLGQRTLILICLPFQLVLWVIMSQARAAWLIIVCRVLQGVTNGIFAGATQTYVAEVCHPSIRGRMLGLLDILRQVGYTFIYSIGNSSLTWRSIALVSGISTPTLPFLIMIPMLDSPRWLAAKGLYHQAEKSLKFYRGTHYQINEELNSIKEDLSNTSKKLKIIDQLKMLKNKSLAVMFSALLVCNFLNHFSASAAIASYSVIIFQAATADVDAYVSTVICGAFRLLGSILFFFISDRYSRRACFLGPHFISLIFIALMGLYFYFQDVLSTISWLSWMPTISTVLFMIFFGMSSPAFGCMRPELLPTEFRSLGISLAYTSFYFGIFTVGITFFDMKNAVGLSGTFWIYSILGLIMFLLVLIFLPETKGKTLEEINVMKTIRSNA